MREHIAQRADATGCRAECLAVGRCATLAAQHGMHGISLGLLPGWDSTKSSENDINRLGFFLGAGAQSPTDAGPEAVHKSDIATAEHLGARVARQAAIFRAGRTALAAPSAA